MQPRDAEPADGRELLARATEGDRSAVGELLYGQTDDLRAFIARRLPAVVQPAIDVDDVLQDTFALAFRGIGGFEGTEMACFSAWLRTIAAHRIADLARTQRRKKRGGGDHRVVPAAASDSILSLYHELAGTDSTPLRKASREEALRVMHIALAELPPDYRDAIRLRFLEDRTTEEIAERLDRTPDAVRGLLRRAKARLKDALGRASSYLTSR